MQYFLYFVVIIAFLALSSANPVQKIVGGEPAIPHEFPYQISIQIELGETHCGGSIINENYILTAAHCKVPENSSVVVAGAHNMVKPNGHEQTRKVAKFIRHKKYKGGDGHLYDIALIKVSKPFILNDYVQRIELPPRDEYPTGEGVVSGWGITSVSDPIILQKAILPIHNRQTCEKMWFDVPNYDQTHVCAGRLDGSNNVCSGDSGGPLAQKQGEKNIVIGIVSWGMIPCATPQKPGVFTLVSSYIDWIHENMQQ
ncbi:trypsin-1-like [Culicoides brevitarsis]|uniref:trypsin-1-like n=1 Tax=Culicoides brevitarsis TaxID=469753 RepID=UPI00307BEBDF